MGCRSETLALSRAWPKPAKCVTEAAINHLRRKAAVPGRARQKGERLAITATAIYLAVVFYLPLYLAGQTCRNDLGHGSGLIALARNWLNCRLRETHLDAGEYGSWLAGTVLIPAVYWAYRAYKAQTEATEQQRRAIFLATIGQQHQRFESLAHRMRHILKEEFKSQDWDLDEGNKYHTELTNAMIRRRLPANNIGVKAALRRTGVAEEYIAEAHAFLDALQRFGLPAYSGGAWRELLNTLEGLFPGGV